MGRIQAYRRARSGGSWKQIGIYSAVFVVICAGYFGYINHEERRINRIFAPYIDDFMAMREYPITDSETAPKGYIEPPILKIITDSKKVDYDPLAFKSMRGAKHPDEVKTVILISFREKLIAKIIPTNKKVYEDYADIIVINLSEKKRGNEFSCKGEEVDSEIAHLRM